MASVIPPANDADVLSDYGSDFTPDEEEMLNSLLDQGANIDNPNLDPKIQLENIKDEQNCQGIKVPLQAWNQPRGSALREAIEPGKKVRIEVDGYQRSKTEKCWSPVSFYWTELTDLEEDS